MTARVKGGSSELRPLIEPDMWFSHIPFADDSCPTWARFVGPGFLCCRFKPPPSRRRCVPRPGAIETCRSGHPSRRVLLSGLVVVTLPYFLRPSDQAGLSGSVQNLSQRAIPNHSTGLGCSPIPFTACRGAQHLCDREPKKNKGEKALPPTKETVVFALKFL